MSILEKPKEAISKVATISASTVCDNMNMTSTISLSQLPQRAYSYTDDTGPDLQIPRKRGGFMIMSVTDNESTDDNNGEESIDGDESCDDLDELRAETAPDDGSYCANQHDHIFPLAPANTSASFTEYPPHTLSDYYCANNLNQNYLPHEHLNASAPQISSGISFEVEAKSRTSSFNYDQHLVLQPNFIDNSCQIGRASIPVHQDTCRNHLSHTSQEPSRNGHNVSTSVSCSSVPVTTKISVSTNITPSKTVASRVYKVVKRESIHPVKRELTRWTCFDFSDVHSPNLSFSVHSINDSRTSMINDSFHSHIASNLTSTSSVGSVYANSIGFNPSESFMSAYGENKYANPSVAYYGQSNSNLNSSTSAYFSSGSSSSITHDVERQKIYKSLKPIFETSEFSKRRHGKSNDSRVSEASSSDQDAFKSLAQHSDTGSNPDYEDESTITSNVQLDNKIEAAMDLVKKHLMLAVRDEVDDLKDRIYELQVENEAMKNLLTSEQLARLQQSLNRTYNSRPGYHTQLSYCQASSMQKPINPPYQVSGSAAYQHANHIGHQASQSTVQQAQLSSHAMSNLRTSTVFCHHQTGSHSPKVPPQQLQSLPNAIPYSQGLHQHHTHERTQHFAPPLTAPVQIPMHNNVPMTQHYPVPQMPNPSSMINPNLPYASNMPQATNTHHPPMT